MRKSKKSSPTMYTVIGLDLTLKKLCLSKYTVHNVKILKR